MKYASIAAGVFCLLSVCSVRGADAPFAPDGHTLFLAHFDQGLPADTAAGKKEPLAGRVAITPQGKFGGAYAATVDPASVLSYSAAGNINPTRGTVEFWYKPNFNLNSPQVPLSIYRLYVSTDDTKKEASGIGINYSSKENYYQIWFYAWGEKRDPGCYGVDKVVDLKKGEWCHIAACWDEKRMSLFLNGRCLGTKERKGNMPFGDTFQLGGDPANAGYADGFIDEFRISDEMRYQAADGTVKMEFPDNRGTGTVIGYGETAEKILFRVDTNCPARVTLRPQVFPVIAGQEFYIASSCDDPRLVNAPRDGEICFDLNAPRNATLIVEKPKGPNLLADSSFETAAGADAAGWFGVAGQKKTLL